MHLVEQYALSCGVKIDKPFIETSYFPVVPEKYITLHANSRIQSKTYDYYNDVVDLIFPYLQQQGIEIVQIGSSDEQQVGRCIHHQGHTTIKQAAYIIKNSMLHLGTDSFSTHVASGFNKKIVSLYSTLYKECCGPYWGDKDNQILLQSIPEKQKASFSDNEFPKTINKILPEKIAKSVLDLLQIKNNLDKIETFHIGKAYHIGSLAVIPNHVMPKNFAPGQPANILGHEHFDEEKICQWGFSRKVNIFLDRPMNINYLQAIKNNIHQINYYVQPDDNETFFKTLKKIGIKLKLVCKDKNKINDIRLKFFDWDVFFEEKKTKKDIDNSEKICDNTRYKSAQVIVSNQKIYKSKAAWKHDKPGEHNKIIDCNEFWEDAVNLKIYNESTT
tara:strand:- start:959 stop:2122 length:1164 start_codon:yes stop_codon:yes gene_type:complete